MILQVFFVFVLISLVLIAIGITKQIFPAWIVGSIMLLVLGGVILNEGLEVASAQMEVTTYSYGAYNLTNVTHTNTNYTYTAIPSTWDVNTIGIITSLCGALVFVLCLFSLKKPKEEDD